MFKLTEDKLGSVTPRRNSETPEGGFSGITNSCECNFARSIAVCIGMIRLHFNDPRSVRRSTSGIEWILLRQGFLVAALLLVGASLSFAEPRFPFPQHVAYTAGVLKPTHVSQAAMDAAVVHHYKAWQSHYVKSLVDSDPVQMWIKYDKTDSTVSEAMGYGMVLAAYMGDQAELDAMFYYVKAHPSSIGKNLLAWKQKLKNGVMKNVQGQDSATDGDMDVAYAMILADRQWGSSGSINYRDQALLILADIMTYCVNPTDWNLLMGDWALEKDTTHSRPSDFMVDHLLAFAAFDTVRADRWMKVYDRITETVNHQFSNGSNATGLMADFYVKDGSHFVPVTGKYLESPHDGDYSYNSCRTPWRLPMAYILSGKSDIHRSQQKMAEWIALKTENDPSKIRAGYCVRNGINGAAFVDYDDLAFTAPFAVNAMLGGNQEWLNKLWSSITGVGAPLAVDYYGDAIRLQVMLVVSGNWWLPTKPVGEERTHK